MRRLYSLFMYLAVPFVLGYFGLRGIRDRRYWRRWGERLGRSPVTARPGAIHVHGASMGEINAANPLVGALLGRRPAPAVLLTTITPTGSHRVRELFDRRVEHCYLPLDLPGAMRRFLDRCQPALIVIMETEVWPNLMHCANARGIPVLIANARLSDRSVRGYRRLALLMEPALDATDRILAQSRADGARFIQCGADPAAVVVAGNLKFDVKVPASLAESAEVLRAGWGAHRPVLVAGSTHPADEAAILGAVQDVSVRLPDALLILAPRYPERFPEAARMAREAGLRTQLRSDGNPVDASTRCLVLDTMGELLNYYAAADVAFVGGTIAAVGGHNVLEPAALGKPVLVGPHTRNVGEVIDRLLEVGAAERVRDRAELAAALGRLFGDASRRDRMGRAGLRLVEKGRGALERTLVEIDRMTDGLTERGQAEGEMDGRS